MEQVEAAASAHDAYSEGSEQAGLTAAEVLEVLWKEYAPFPWEPRYDPISEVVFTILSQHLSLIHI